MGQILFAVYFVFLSWQLLTPVTIVSAGGYDKLIHFGAFFVLGALANIGWHKTVLIKLGLILLAYAAATEIIQHFVPGRSLSLLDWLADGAGIFFALSLSAVCARFSGKQILRASN